MNSATWNRILKPNTPQRRELKETPLLFKTEMILALLGGTKTQTRRLMKPQPDSTWPHSDGGEPYWHIGGCRLSTSSNPLVCPFGKPGDRIWAKETHQLVRPTIVCGGSVSAVELWPGRMPKAHPGQDWMMWTAAGSDETSLPIRDRLVKKWRPSIFMPRWASRISLEITEVRAQRLQDITPDEASAEGIAYPDHVDVRRVERCPLVDGYAALWDSINGKGAWDLNPWVWCLSFKVMK